MSKNGPWCPLDNACNLGVTTCWCHCPPLSFLGFLSCNSFRSSLRWSLVPAITNEGTYFYLSLNPVSYEFLLLPMKNIHWSTLAQFSCVFHSQVETGFPRTIRRTLQSPSRIQTPQSIHLTYHDTWTSSQPSTSHYWNSGKQMTQHFSRQGNMPGLDLLSRRTGSKNGKSNQ